jgi:hypothetical protein
MKSVHAFMSATVSAAVAAAVAVFRDGAQPCSL